MNNDTGWRPAPPRNTPDAKGEAPRRTNYAHGPGIRIDHINDGDHYLYLTTTWGTVLAWSLLMMAIGVLIARAWG